MKPLSKFILLLLLFITAFAAGMIALALAMGGWNLMIVRLTIHSNLPNWIKQILWRWV